MKVKVEIDLDLEKFETTEDRYFEIQRILSDISDDIAYRAILLDASRLASKGVNDPLANACYNKHYNYKGDACTATLTIAAGE